MKIYHYNQYGYYCGQDIADESPLEPGVFLIPAMATDQEPPSPQEGKNIIFADGQWQLVDIVVEPEPVVVPLTKMQKLTALKAEYDPQIITVQTQIAIAVSVTKNTVAETTWRNSLATLQAEFTTKRSAILNG